MTNDLGPANRHIADSVQILCRRLAVIHFRQRKFRAGQDAAQQIVEVVRDTTRERADAFQLLPGKIFFPDALDVADIQDSGAIGRLAVASTVSQRAKSFFGGVETHLEFSNIFQVIRFGSFKHHKSPGHATFKLTVMQCKPEKFFFVSGRRCSTWNSGRAYSSTHRPQGMYRS